MKVNTIWVSDCPHTSSDLKFQVFETSEGFGRSVDIAFDDTGHIYVSDHQPVLFLMTRLSSR